MDGWLRFFRRAISVQVNDAVNRAERITDLRKQFRRRLHGSRTRAHELIDLVLQNPYLTTVGATRALGVTPQGASNLLRQLEGVGILTSLPRVSGRSNRWVAHEILDALAGEVA